MAIFSYTGKDKSGKPVKGRVESGSESATVKLLNDQGVLVLSVKPAGADGGGFIPGSGSKKVGFNDLVAFTRQLSTMITAGLPLVESLIILGKQTKNPGLVKILDAVVRDIEGGATFTTALEKHPESFSKLYISLVKAGESAGILDTVLLRLATNLEKTKALRSKIKGALLYPVIVTTGMIIVFILMMVLVVPKMMGIFKDFNVELPIYTKMLIFISDFMVNFWWLLVAGALGGFFLFKRWRATALGRKTMDKLMIGLPVWGKVQAQAELVEFTRTLGILVGSGIPILEALNIVSQSLDNMVFKEEIAEAAVRIEKGFTLGSYLAESKTFPPVVGQMVLVGEATGKLDETLQKVSSYFESESEEMVKGLTTAIEPIIMVVLGLGVGFLVFSIIMPIYSLTNSIQ